jgi:DNA-binding response OmpR family regulator
MYVLVDERPEVTDAYVSSFRSEGVASLGFRPPEFGEWLRTSSPGDIEAVQSCLLGDFDERPGIPQLIRSRTNAPIIALADVRSLDATLELFTAGIDDVVRKPVHVRELMARSDAIWRRINHAHRQISSSRLRMFFDGRDVEIDGTPLLLPRRERHILEFLARNAHRRVTKTQIFNAVYGLFEDKVDEVVIEGHVSKLRKKLRLQLGCDVIDAKRYLGYQFVGADLSSQAETNAATPAMAGHQPVHVEPEQSA